MLMEGDPYALIEGMTIAGLAVQATYGYIYVRHEYPHAIATLQAAADIARRAGWLGAASRFPPLAPGAPAGRFCFAGVTLIRAYSVTRH